MDPDVDILIACEKLGADSLMLGVFITPLSPYEATMRRGEMMQAENKIHFLCSIDRRVRPFVGLRNRGSVPNAFPTRAPLLPSLKGSGVKR